MAKGATASEFTWIEGLAADAPGRPCPPHGRRPGRTRPPTGREYATTAAPGRRVGVANEEWQSAIESGCVSFDQVASAYFALVALRRAGLERDPVYEQLDGYLPKLLRVFQDTHGTITRRYYCEHTESAVVLTSKGEIHMVQPPGARYGEVQRLLGRCYRLYVEVSRLLSGIDRSICALKIFSIMVDLLSALNQSVAARLEPASANDGTSALPNLALWVESIADAEDDFQRCARRSAQFNYFRGMLFGVLGLALLVVLAFAAHDSVWMPTEALIPIVITLTVGGAGAAASSMLRLASGKLTLDYELGYRTLILLGAFRAVVGAIFAFIVLEFLKAGLLPLTQPSEASALHYYAAIGFVAGFSERWAKDVLQATERHLAGRGGSGDEGRAGHGGATTAGAHGTPGQDALEKGRQQPDRADAARN